MFWLIILYIFLYLTGCAWIVTKVVPANRREDLHAVAKLIVVIFLPIVIIAGIWYQLFNDE